MSEPIQWESLSEKNKIDLILERVMPHYVLPEDAQVIDEMAICGDHILYDFHWPVASWDEWDECWQTREKGDVSHSFDPLHSLDDAWLVVRAMNWRDEHNERYLNFVFEMEQVLGSSRIFDLLSCEFETDQPRLTPEKVCIAALRAVGMEVAYIE